MVESKSSKLKNDFSAVKCGFIASSMKDEAKAHKEYMKHGLKEIASDEHDHYEILKAQQDAKNCKKKKAGKKK